MQEEALKELLYWIKERHSIFLKKEQGKPWPWTKDPILQEYKFTNPFRENDRQTQLLRQVHKDISDPVQLFHTIVVFRMFNWAETYYELEQAGLLRKWSAAKATKLLTARQQRGEKVFTGAYMMTGSGSEGTGGKIAMACQTIQTMWRDAPKLVTKIQQHNSLQWTTEALSVYTMVGSFVGYEIATDLRHTPVLCNAEDLYTWANPGPGAKRGIHRLLFGSAQKPSKERVDYVEEMRKLLLIIQKRLGRLKMFEGVKFEMRDVEHSLCEFDKYMRLKLGEGVVKSKYWCWRVFNENHSS